MHLWNDKRLRLSLTRLGVEYMIVMALMGFFAVNSGNNLLYLIFSLMLGLFLVSGWVSRRAIRGLELQSIEEGNMFARVKGGVRVRFRDTHPRRIRALEVDLRMEQGRVEPGFYGGGQASDGAVLVVLHARPELRGWRRIEHLELRTRFPFGFLEKTWKIPLEANLLVLPHPRSATPLRDRAGETRFQLPTKGSSSPEGARPFRMGDPPSRVHWKRTAQRGAPWIRTFEGEQPQGLRLHLDVRQWAPGPPFEKELELLSGAILQARLQKQDVFLTLDSHAGRSEHAGPTDCWRALAVAEAEGPLTLAPPEHSAAFTSPGMAIP